jgi:hypothetical protein
MRQIGDTERPRFAFPGGPNENRKRFAERSILVWMTALLGSLSMIASDAHAQTAPRLNLQVRNIELTDCEHERDGRKSGPWTSALEWTLRFRRCSPTSPSAKSDPARASMLSAICRSRPDGTVAVDMDPLSLLCRLATAVPPPRYHMVKYAGVLDAPRGSNLVQGPAHARMAARRSVETSPRNSAHDAGDGRSVFEHCATARPRSPTPLFGHVLPGRTPPCVSRSRGPRKRCGVRS